ncbi:hypothetical protein HDU87_008698 [Geranomyces variabilis]|uniref:Uncharacterized protein n=1 Tax=Geranomyces variabilis TaxID=109894 RepID=A0AAD5TD76_9FUNG|nr:hypothetical protein HDU87_008698 [Geranomyces variabilis]
MDAGLSFNACWVIAINTGMNWVQLVGCVLIFYGYIISARVGLWNVVLAHGVTGFLGTTLETAFTANMLSGSERNVALLLGFNEINWIAHETLTVYYSLRKTEIALTNNRFRNYLRALMGILALGFAGLRINIGRLRVRDNTTSNSEILEAHSYAFIAWGLADLIIFALLLLKTRRDVKEVADAGMSSQTGGLLLTLMKSSLLRLTVICVNTLAIIVVGQYTEPGPALQSFGTFLWMVKGTYPMILLFDIMSTQAAIRGHGSLGGGTGSGAKSTVVMEAKPGRETSQLLTRKTTRSGRGADLETRTEGEQSMAQA